MVKSRLYYKNEAEEPEEMEELEDDDSEFKGLDDDLEADSPKSADEEDAPEEDENLEEELE